MAKPKQLILKGEVVKQSNDISRSQLQLRMDAKNKTVCGRIIATIAAKININDEELKPYTFPAIEILSVSRGGSVYDAIDAATDDLMTAFFIKRYTDEKGKKAFKKYTVFNSIEYKDGQITATFSAEVKDHFLNLKHDFTKYGLIEYLMLTSRYSQKLFEVLCSWKNASAVTLELDDLFFTLSVPVTLQRYPDFRRYVLERAHKEITSFTNLEFEWLPIKEGRAVTKIRFIFGKKRISEHKAQEQQTQKQKKAAANNKLFMAVIACRKQKGFNSNKLCNQSDCASGKRKLCQEMFNQHELI